jgi:tetratricopeptide (TPR) repeat protein
MKGNEQLSMRQSIILSYAVASLFCACLPFAPTPLHSAPRPLAEVFAKNGHATRELRLIDFISRRKEAAEDPMPGQRSPLPAPPGYVNDRFAEPRCASIDSTVGIRDDAIEEARTLAAEGRDEDALLLLNGLILENDEFMAAYLERAKIYLHKGVYDLAVVDFREAISCRAGNVEAHYNLGIAYEKWAEKLEAAGGGPRAYEKFREAIGEYKKAVWYDPGYAPAYYGLGCACSRMGMRDDARHYFQKAIETSERDSGIARRARYNLLLLGGY